MRNINGMTELWDGVRKKYILLQPEELLRQLVVQWFIHDLNLSCHKIQVEKQFKVNGRIKRFDIVVYDSDVKPYILVECKSHNEPIDQKVFDQISVYQSAIAAPYLLLTNGIHSYLFTKDETLQKYIFEPSLERLTSSLKK